MGTESEMVDQTQESTVWVRRQWDDSSNQAKYRLTDLEDPRWDIVSGGVQTHANQPYIHGYVWCDDMLEGEVSHSCAHGEGPHRIKVCVVKRSNQKAVFDQLLAVVGPKPYMMSRKERERAMSRPMLHARRVNKQ